MNARVSAPFQRGWCSWYHYFHAITEDALRANIKSLEAMRSEFPLDVIQLDDGFQSALGDWDTTNAKFPSGLKKIAAEIRAAGFKAGIWTAPFLAARDSRLMIDHPDWFITRAETNDREPVRAGHNPNWTASDDKFAYALDPSNPAFVAHLAPSVRETHARLRLLVPQAGFSLRRCRARPASRSESHARRNFAPRPRRHSRRRRRRRLHPRMRLPAGAGRRRRRRDAHRARRFAILGLNRFRSGRPLDGLRARRDHRAQLHASPSVAERSRLPDAARARNPTHRRRTRGTGRNHRRQRRDAPDFRRHEPARRRSGKIIPRSRANRPGDRFKRRTASQSSRSI